MIKRHYHILTARTLAGIKKFETKYNFVLLEETISEFKTLTATDDGTFAAVPGDYNISQEGFVAIGYKPDEQDAAL